MVKGFLGNSCGGCAAAMGRDFMHRRMLRAMHTIAWMAVALFFVTGIFLMVGLDEQLYFKLQMRENVPQTAGISEADLMLLDERLSLCLDGAQSWNKNPETGGVLSVSVHGAQQPAFNDREITHMQDCQRLFSILEGVNIALAVTWLIMEIAARVYIWLHGLKDESNWSLRIYWIGSGIILAPLAVLAVWAAVDFDSAFTFFHKILFTNDLWLLDPRTDLLINICPQSMFMSMGLRIALPAFGILLGTPLLATLMKLFSGRHRKAAA